MPQFVKTGGRIVYASLFGFWFALLM